MSRRERIAALERARMPSLTGGVLVYDPEVETPEQAAARSNRRGGCLVMPTPVDADTWEAQAGESQRDLLARAEAHARMLADRHK